MDAENGPGCDVWERQDAMSVIDPSQTAVPRLGRPDSEAEWRAGGVRRGGTAMCGR